MGGESISSTRTSTESTLICYKCIHLVEVQWLAVGLFSNNFAGQLHKLLPKLIVPRELAAGLRCRWRANVFAGLVGHGRSVLEIEVLALVMSPS